MLTRRKPLSRKSALPKQRKPLCRRKKAIPAVAQRYMARIRAMPCLVCGAHPPNTAHHVTASIHGGRLTRCDFRVVPLCRRHHLIQDGPRESVEALSHRGFFEKYNIDLLAVAERLRAEAPHG